MVCTILGNSVGLAGGAASPVGVLACSADTGWLSGAPIGLAPDELGAEPVVFGTAVVGLTVAGLGVGAGAGAGLGAGAGAGAGLGATYPDGRPYIATTKIVGFPPKVPPTTAIPSSVNTPFSKLARWLGLANQADTTAEALP